MMCCCGIFLLFFYEFTMQSRKSIILYAMFTKLQNILGEKIMGVERQGVMYDNLERSLFMEVDKKVVVLGIILVKWLGQH